MKIASVKEMREIDKRAIENYGMPEILLMENAGRAAATAFENHLGGVRGKKLCVLAGSGNNGGDAFVAARHLMNHGAKVKIFLAGNPAHLTASTALNRDIALRMGIEVHALESERDWDKLQVVLRFADGVIDGVLGTGFTGALRENIERLVQLVNEMHRPVLAVDLPTGVDADTGAVASSAIRAELTVTFGLPKFGHLLCPGEACTGKLLVDDIGIPAVLLEDETIRQFFLDEELAASVLLPRAIDAHKGSCGRILVLAGSRGMTGAAVLCSEAVLRSGAGIAVLAVPESLHDLMEIKLTEVMTIPMAEDAAGDGCFGLGDLSALLELSGRYDAVLLGPGLGRQPHTLQLVRDFAAQVKKPLFLDADAIYAFRGCADTLKELAFVPVLTPHLGEMAALLDVTVPELKESLLDITREAAKEYHAVFVVKSECTIVVYPDGRVFVTSTGNPGMATAGSGDVLAGAIAGLTRQTAAGLAPLAGVYLHGLAGDLAAKQNGRGLLASDILHRLPEAVRQLEKCNPEAGMPEE